MGTQFFFTEGKEGKEGVMRRGEFIRPVWVYARSATGADFFEPRMDTDEHGWVRSFFTEGKEGKEGVRRGGIPAAQVGSRRVAQQVRADFFNH